MIYKKKKLAYRKELVIGEDDPIELAHSTVGSVYMIE